MSAESGAWVVVLLSLGAEGNTAAAGYSASITSASMSASTSAQNAFHVAAPPPPVSSDLDLTAELVAPGVTLSSPATRTVLFVASIQADTNAPGEVAQSGSSDIAIQVECISAPPGVTWVSDSGAFGAPTCSAAVPGLASWAVAALVLAFTWTAGLWIEKRRRHLEAA